MIQRYASVIVLSVLSLTLLFAAPEVMRPAYAGGGRGLMHSLGDYAVVWGVWGAIAALVSAGTELYQPRRRLHISIQLLTWFLIALLCSVAHSVISGLILARTGLLDGIVPPAILANRRLFLLISIGSSFGQNLIMFALIVVVLRAVRYNRDLRAKHMREVDLEARLVRAELGVLRMQLQPHFLFNALHTVSSLLSTDPAAARRVIVSLGDILRASIDHIAQQEVPLREELAFVERYVDIQQARFRSRLKIVQEIAPETLSAMVPSLILQPLVENAIRHGIERSPTGGTVWIHTERVKEDLLLRVRDDGQGDVVDSDAVPASVGVGLSNIEARMSQLYGDAQRFRAGRGIDGGFEVELVMPFRLTQSV